MKYNCFIKRDTHEEWINSKFIPRKNELIVAYCDLNTIYKKGDGIHCYADLKEITDISELAPFFMLFANNGDIVKINMCPPLKIPTKGETNVSADT